MDYLETNPPTPEMVMPLIRAAGLAKPQPAPAGAPATTASPLTATGASNLKRIREALAR
jgi:hypothetical protein